MEVETPVRDSAQPDQPTATQPAIANWREAPPYFYTRILDNLTTATLLLNQNLDIFYLNPAAKSLFFPQGYRLHTHNISQLLTDEADTIQQLQACLETGQPYTRHSFQLQLPKSRKFTVDYTVSPLFAAGEAPALLVEIVQIDKLLRMSREESLLNTHTLTRTLIRGVAHEVKNPLGGIRGAAQLLGKELSAQAAAADLTDYIEVIIKETDRLRSLVDRMLGPRELPQISACNIHHILEHVIQLICAEHKTQVQLLRDYDVSLPWFAGDRDQLIQAIFNIVGNAVQALHEFPPSEPGKIMIKTRVLRQLLINGERHKLAICVQIADNGPGIEQSLLQAIFLPMVSGRAEGTGLGLSIAQEILNQHKGIIECESSPGNTEFFLFIPIIAPPTKPQE